MGTTRGLGKGRDHDGLGSPLGKAEHLDCTGHLGPRGAGTEAALAHLLVEHLH